ncbi:polymerase delta-interacting protein 3 [Aquarana catesbeiana]|uniref:polymerase delta-interacting protein 3 n=1 Tax=Aquarana catesbeiana TaxID=8400 RepID=UPI003CC95A58
MAASNLLLSQLGPTIFSNSTVLTEINKNFSVKKKVVKSLHRNFGVRRSKNQLRKCWSDLKLREHDQYRSIRRVLQKNSNPHPHSQAGSSRRGGETCSTSSASEWLSASATAQLSCNTSPTRHHRVSNRVTVRSKLQPSVSGRPLVTSFPRTFDARQKIGVMDARLKLGIKDAREKLIAKDARFRINGKLQDARQMLNSRMDAREKISLKRSAPAVAIHSPTFWGSSAINLTKTIQNPETSVQHWVKDARSPETVTFCTRANRSQMSSQQDADNEEDMELGHIPTKQIKVTATNKQKEQTGMSLPLTKVVRNDTYAASIATHPVTTAPSQNVKSLTGVSRTLIAKATAIMQPASTEPAFSPIEGTKMTVNNLHPRVTEEDIVELFCVCGALKRARLLSPGVAEVVFVRKEDAVGAYKKYNNRYLDGQPMKCNLHLNGTVITSDQPILLRLSDAPSSAKMDVEMRRNSSSSRTSNPVAEVDPETILKALFKSSGSSAVVHPTAFKIKL